ncbi:MAG: tRNA guanosine(34) transglycosylase Tgt [Bacteroidota bacterium]
MQFTIQHEDVATQARTGVLTTDHGNIATPIFMPVGTQGTVKGVAQRVLVEEVKAQIILGNTYHLYLRPGIDIIEQAGGLHRFIGWQQPILTDSGGYQVYSLSKQRKITEEGVHFISPLDGSRHLFTPENAVDRQRSIGADIIMAFDECTPFPCTYEYARLSMERTHRWLDRCGNHLIKTQSHYGYQQAFFPIVQGGIYPDLRRASADYIAKADFPGNAIGGVCHPTGQLYEVTKWVCDILPKNKPRYLMGVGTPQDILESIALGVDMFDCVMPTRNGRNGTLFTPKGRINIKNQCWKRDFSPICTSLGNVTSAVYTKAYLHHLIRVGERLGAQIATIHNLSFYLWLVQQARQHIKMGNFSSWKAAIIPQLMQKIT